MYPSDIYLLFNNFLQNLNIYYLAIAMRGVSHEFYQLNAAECHIAEHGYIGGYSKQVNM